jgi:hypothetical protein
MKLREYAEAMLKWSEIEPEATYDSMRRICLFGDRWLYATRPDGALYVWKDGFWHLNPTLYSDTSDKEAK